MRPELVECALSSSTCALSSVRRATPWTFGEAQLKSFVRLMLPLGGHRANLTSGGDRR